MLVEKGTSTRFFEPKINSEVVSVLPGHFFVTGEPDLAISTLLGSCVAACIRDTRTGFGGLNHFLLPDADAARSGGFSSRYGVHAMEMLVNEILKAGGSREHLEAKAFGGARVIDTSSSDPIGARNGQFVRDYLASEGISLVATDLGGSRARRVYYYPNSGNVTVQRLPLNETGSATAHEAALKQSMAKAKPSGAVELF